MLRKWSRSTNVEQRHGTTIMQHRGCVMRILAPLMMGSTLMELGTNYIFHGKRKATLRHLLCLTTLTQLTHGTKKKKKKTRTVHLKSLCKFGAN